VSGTLETFCLLFFLLGTASGSCGVGGVLCFFTYDGICLWAEESAQDTCTAQSKLASDLAGQGPRRLNNPSPVPFFFTCKCGS